MSIVILRSGTRIDVAAANAPKSFGHGPEAPIELPKADVFSASGVALASGVTVRVQGEAIDLVIDE